MADILGMSIVNITMVFHRILDFKMGWISILALFLFYLLEQELILPHNLIHT